MLPYVLILLAFAADRLSKLWAADFLANQGIIRVNALLTLQPTYNRGIAFGMLQGIGPVIGWLSVGIVLFLVAYLARVPRSQRLLQIGLALLVGGALGNLVDRVTAGQVLDFIRTPLRPGVFNVADLMIHLGLALTLIASFRRATAQSLSQEVEPDRTTAV